MLEFVHDLTQIFTGIFGLKDEDISTRDVTASLNFKSMSKEELQELQAILKKAIASSKVGSGMVAAFFAIISGGFVFGAVGPVQGTVLGFIIFFVIYEIKRYEYWKFFFSFSAHFYKPIKARHLYISQVIYMGEYGYFGAPVKMFKTSREFAKANNGRKMNESRATYELNLINQLLVEERDEGGGDSGVTIFTS